MGISRSPDTSAIFSKLVNPLICITIILVLLYVGQDILKPFAFSCLVALLLVSPSKYFEEQGFPRGAAAMISLILATVLFTVVSYFISNSIASFKNDLPLLMDNIDQSIDQLKLWVQNNFDLTKKDADTVVEASADKVVPSTSSIVNTTVNTVTGIIFVGILIFITTFLLLLYRGLIVVFFLKLFSDQYSEKIRSIFAQTRFIIRSYIVGLFLEMLIVAAVNCTVFFILGIKYALLLGVLSAVLNIIPYIGIFVACIISALITLTTDTPTTVVWVVVSLIIIHMLDSNILMPRIMGKKVKINALATILGVVVGSALWGIPGTFMAVPIMAIMKVIFEEIEAFHPFAILMGDDDSEKSLTKPVLRRLANSVRKKPK